MSDETEDRLATVERLFLNATYRIDVWGEYNTDSNWRISDRVFFDYDFVFMVKGGGDISINDRSYRIAGPQLYIFKPGDIVNAVHDPRHPIRMFAMHFFVLDETGQDLFKYFVVPDRIKISNPSLLESIYLSYLECSSPVGIHLRKKVAFLQIVEFLLRNSFLKLDDRIYQVLKAGTRIDSYSRAFFRIYDYIESNLSKHLSLEELSRQFFMSRNTLIRLCKRETGLTPLKFINKIRMENALTMLNTGHDITSVAFSLGYSEVFSFSKQFKQHYGYPPRNYVNSISSLSHTHRGL